jgi:hypothetical protein
MIAVFPEPGPPVRITKRSTASLSFERATGSFSGE